LRQARVGDCGGTPGETVSGRYSVVSLSLGLCSWDARASDRESRLLFTMSRLGIHAGGVIFATGALLREGRFCKFWIMVRFRRLTAEKLGWRCVGKFASLLHNACRRKAWGMELRQHPDRLNGDFGWSGECREFCMWRMICIFRGQGQGR